MISENTSTPSLTRLNGSWNSAPTPLGLSREDVHVWLCYLDQTTTASSQFIQTLSSDELRRANQFYTEKDKRYFILCRSLLRMILSHYLDMEPHQIRFCYGPYGKPELVRSSYGENIEFNLSHSNNLVLYAITRDLKVGIDVEHLRDIPRMELLVERHFSLREIDSFHNLPLSQRQVMFFRYWTRKEAYTKAIGQGLTFPLNGIDTSWIQMEKTERQSTHLNHKGLVSRGLPASSNFAIRCRNFHKDLGYSFFDLHPTQDYIASIAAEGSGCHLTHWQCLETSDSTHFVDKLENLTV